jgi:hypothetical protein
MNTKYGARAQRAALVAIGLLATAAAPAALAQNAPGSDGSILKSLKHISVLGSTVPMNGDVNPYGMAQVKNSVGKLTAGHILVSNFNNSSNAQGTGTTIVDMAPNGSQSLFATLDPAALPGPCPGGVGLTTALVVLNEGWVIVGSLPTKNGASPTAKAGCLIVLDSMGTAVETIDGTLINGPWDMTAFESGSQADLFVTNVLNGTVAAKGNVVQAGTVVRVALELSSNAPPAVQSLTVVASGFSERTDPAALVLGPTGVALNRSSCEPFDFICFALLRLYVADTLNNRITVVFDPLLRPGPQGTGATFSSGGSLNGPLGLIVDDSSQHLLSVNGVDGFITEINAQGTQIAKTLLDGTGGPPPGNGTLFGLVYDPAHGVFFVDDGSNTLNLLH